jgi:DNA-binding MarR family transcriptional regulator
MKTSPPGTFEHREFTLQVIRHQQAIAAKLGLNLTDFKCLGLLHRSGPMTPTQWGEALGLTQASMTAVVDRLEKARYARRKRDSGDRRSVRVHATPGSETRVSRLYRSLRIASQRLMTQYSEEELALISAFLSKATEVLRAATAELT